MIGFQEDYFSEGGYPSRNLYHRGTVTIAKIRVQQAFEREAKLYYMGARE